MNNVNKKMAIEYRRAMAFMLTIALLFSFGSFAYATGPEPLTGVKVELQNAEGQPGDSVTMAVYMDPGDDFEFWAYDIQLNYDAEILEPYDPNPDPVNGFSPVKDELSSGFFEQDATTEGVISWETSYFDEIFVMSRQKVATVHFKIKNPAKAGRVPVTIASGTYTHDMDPVTIPDDSTHRLNGIVTVHGVPNPAKFSAVDSSAGKQDRLQGAAGAVNGAGLTMKAYPWTDLNQDAIVASEELGTAISLGQSAADGSVAAADIGDLAPGTYKYVLTATDGFGYESRKEASAAFTAVLVQDVVTGAVEISLGSVTAQPGATVSIPVKAKALTQGIGSYGIQIDFDPNALEFAKVENPIGPMFFHHADNSGGWVRAAWVDETGGDALITGEKVLFNLVFKIKESFVSGSKALQVDVNDIMRFTFTDVDAREMNKTFTAGSITVNKPSSGGGGGGGGSSSPDTITLDVEDGSNAEGGIVSRATVIRTTDGNGRKKDELTFTAEQALQAIERLKKAGSNTARIVVPDAKDEVSELLVKLPKAAASALADSKVDLELVTNGARILIPYGSFQGVAEDIYFRLVPVKSESGQNAIEKQAAAEKIVGDRLDAATLNIMGRPMQIETNMPSRPVTLILPLGDSKPTAEQVTNLFVFIQHSDGTKELIKGELVPYDASGKQGIRFTVNHFSTFTVLEGKSLKSTVTHKAYLKGFKDGTFRPDKEMTRAEMAKILSNLSEDKDQSTSTAYKDVPANHWASAAIAKVTRNGLMKGSSEGNFDPDRTITRAEMAMIALRLKTASASQDAAFKDIAGHWAEVSIQQAKAAGYMNGYADGTFRPDQTLTRAEAVMILNGLLGREPVTTAAGKWSDVSERYWAYGAIQAATVDHTSEK